MVAQGQEVTATASEEGDTALRAEPQQRPGELCNGEAELPGAGWEETLLLGGGDPGSCRGDGRCPWGCCLAGGLEGEVTQAQWVQPAGVRVTHTGSLPGGSPGVRKAAHSGTTLPSPTACFGLHLHPALAGALEWVSADSSVSLAFLGAHQPLAHCWSVPYSGVLISVSACPTTGGTLNGGF